MSVSIAINAIQLNCVCDKMHRVLQIAEKSVSMVRGTREGQRGFNCLISS